MEVEAKFSIPDQATFDRLRIVETLAGLQAGQATLKQDHDRYLDTPDRALMAGGYACRWRMRQGSPLPLITVKALTPASDHLHSREEIEVTLTTDSTADPTTWPVSEARQVVASLSQGRPLATLFEVWQERHVRLLRAPGALRPLIELSLDRVRLGYVDAPDFFELEAELLAEDAEDWMAALVDALQAQWRLVPEPRSKFERGLARLSP